ncbi:MAG: pyridoxal-phosphate dependent enzyme [Hyphomicrobiales bacterium]|nr:pyridoxal-phosphate dependent enzyme [Hyphomicrobiales bacterium]
MVYTPTHEHLLTPGPGRSRGSGICGLLTVRDLLGLQTEIVGVVADNAPAFALSMAAGRPVPTNAARTFADGMACREPQPEPFAIIQRGAAEIVRVGEDEIAEAIRILHVDTHSMAEGAGAAALAALLQLPPARRGRRVAVVLSGGNIDMPVLSRVLAGETPSA